MTLERISEIINERIDTKDNNRIIFTYYQLRVKENLSENDLRDFIYYGKIRLEKLGYKVYLPGQRYTWDYANRFVQDNELLLAIKFSTS